MDLTNLSPFERGADRERGQVGIGTLIVFIAMVLVAAIAAGVLVNTAGFLQEKSQQTGEQSTNQVVDRIQAVSTTGDYDSASSTIDEINIVVKRNSGAGVIDLSSTSVELTGDQGTTSVKVSNSAITTTELKGTSGASVLTEDVDRVKVEININAAGSGIYGKLSAGEEVTLKLTTPSGATTMLILQAPDPLPTTDDAAVQL